MKSKHLLYFSMVFNCIFVLAIFYALFWINQNTSFLQININKDDIKDNNSNEDSTTEISDITTLVPKNLIVADQFKIGSLSKARTLNMPEGFSINVFAANLPGVRALDFNEEGVMFASTKLNKVYSLIDDNSDGVVDIVNEVATDLQVPHGLDFFEGDLYIAEEHQVIVFKNINADGSYSEKKVLVANLPEGGHITRTVRIGPDRKMYVSIGSSCNVCEESDSRRAAIVRYNLDGSGEEIFASGLRNTVDFEFRLRSDLSYKIFGVDNGRDMIGDDIPPEEVNSIEFGGNYGWPYCYGKRITNPEYSDRSEYCQNSTKDSYVDMQAHSAPLGIAFMDSTNAQFPSGMQKDAYIGFHGSWNRSTPTGYKVVRVDLENPDSDVINFITGWLDEGGNYWGRPVDTIFGPDGSLFITDDYTNSIYKVTYENTL